MDEINIKANIIIDEVDETLDRLRKQSGFYTLEIQNVVDFIQMEEDTCFYLDEKMNIKNENDKGIKYLWLDTGLENENTNKAIFLSLLYQDGYFVGHFVGDYKFLSNTIARYFPSNIRMIRENAERFNVKYEKRISKRENKHLTAKLQKTNPKILVDNDVEQVTEIGKQILAQNLVIENTDSKEEVNEHIPAVPREITNNVMELLMINNWRSIDGLDRYLKVIGCRLQQLVEQNKTEYYIINNIKSVVANTGLLNQFASDIHIMYRYHVSSNVYVAYKIMESKTDYLENGYSKDQISRDILPINFFDKGEELFEATMDDFDINHKSLMHIVEERRNRFPENVREVSANMIATKINNALELGLKMQKRDRGYAKPSYSTKNKAISWLMPLHINTELTEEPELVLVIRKNKEYYEIKTIIPYDDDMKDRITALSLYNGMW